jgi:DNA helicase HerA-like ATPase
MLLRTSIEIKDDEHRDFLQKAAAGIEGKVASESRLAAIYTNSVTQRLRDIKKLQQQQQDPSNENATYKFLLDLPVL